LLKAISGDAGTQPTNFAESVAGLGASTDTLETRLAEARASLATATEADGRALTNAPAGVSANDIPLRRGLLQRLVRVYEQQLSNMAELESVRRHRAELAREAQAWTGFTEPRPYSILLPDGLREELQAERLKLSNATDALSLLDQSIEENRASLKQAEGSIRQLNEQLEAAEDPAARARLSWQRDLDQLRSQVAAATLGMLDLERQLQQERSTASRTRIASLQQRLVMADAGAKFTEADLDKIVARLEAERRQLEEELAEAETRQRTALRALEASREELRGIQDQSATNPSATARATELVELRRAQLETADTSAKVLRLMLETINTERTMWEMRYAAYDTRNAGVLRQSEQRLEVLARRVELWKDYEIQQLAVSSGQIAIQQARLADLDSHSDLLPLAREHLVTLQERDQLLLRLVRDLDRAQRLAQRWSESLQEAAGKLPFIGRLRNLFSGTRSVVANLWNFELFTAMDTITVDGQPITGKRSITLGKIILALLILVGGIWVSDLASRFLEPIIVRRLKIEPNQASLIRRWLRALMVLALVVFSLLSVKIPLTVFAFAGGALAIGVGFGLQTILKNLISGIIILFERPFRVGDVLDVAGQKGTITTIGLRASVLQLWDGTETLIPNSALLENAVTNWTYTSRAVRFTITVGVAYGSDTRRVIQLLSEVADRHGLVEKSPKPQVLFTDFADSALTFELRFWVDVVKGNAAQVSSDLRQMIAGAFDEHSIVIAFPQRDIRLDATRPLPVQVVTPTEIRK
jgi:small-conductance mechanosensitive channel